MPSNTSNFIGLSTILEQLKSLGFETVYGGEVFAGLLLDMPLSFDENCIILAFSDEIEILEGKTKEANRSVTMFVFLNKKLKENDSFLRLIMGKTKSYANEKYLFNSAQTIQNLFDYSQNRGDEYERFAHLFNGMNFLEVELTFKYKYQGCIELNCECE
jgi:hypothetical protein